MKTPYFQGTNEGWVEPYKPTSDRFIIV